MQQNEIHIRDYLRILLKRRYVLFAFFFITFSLVVLLTFTAHSVYRAKTKLLIEKSDQYSITEYGFTAYDPQFYATQYQIIKSRPVAIKVYEALQDNALFNDYFSNDKGDEGVVKSIRMSLSSLFDRDSKDSSEAEGGSRRGEFVDALQESIHVFPVVDTKLVTVSFDSRSPEVARLVANTVAKAYMEALFELRMDSSQRALNWMTRKVSEERLKLDDSEKLLQEYSETYDIVTLEDRIAIVPQKLMELGTQLTRSETKRREIETLYSKIRSLQRSGSDLAAIPSVALDKTVAFLHSQVLEGEQKISELSKKYGEKHPLMIEAVEDLRTLKKKKSQEVLRVVESINNEYDLSLSNEQNIRKSLAQTKLEAHTINEKFVKYNSLKRDVETSRQIYESLLKKMREESIEKEGQAVNVMLVESAELPTFPQKPRKALNLIAGLLVGLLGGSLLAFFFEYFDNTVKSADDAEQRLGVPVLGMVGLLMSEQRGLDRSIERIVLEEPKSAFTENYKALRTSVMLSSAESSPKTLLVTSMGPSEGKTSTAVNLALVIAQSDNKVLLVDTDLRKPRVHKIFGVANKSGLSTYMTGSNAKIIKEGPHPNINIIPSGPLPPNPSELLGSEKFTRFLSTMKDRYDVIIFDSPPALTVTDSLVLSKYVDGTIIVARAAKTTYEAVEKGVRQFRDLGSNVLGLLINAIDSRKGGYYYNYYYYHNYNYYYSSDEEKLQEK